MYGTILVLLDGSQRAEAILRHVEELALHFRSRVIFVRVLRPPSLVMAPEAAYMKLRRREHGNRMREAEAYLAVQQGKFRQIGVEAETRVLFGPVVEAVVKTAEREGADLIALASQEPSGLTQVFYGSVAAGLLQRIHLPLLLVRAQPAEPK